MTQFDLVLSWRSVEAAPSSSEILRKTMQWIAIATHDFVHCQLYNKIMNHVLRRRDAAVRVQKKLTKEQRHGIRVEARRWELL